MELKLQINEAEVIEAAKKVAMTKATNIVNDVINTHFQSASYWGKIEGPGTLIIKQKIDEMLLSKDLDAKINEAIDRHLSSAICYLAKEHVRHSVGKIIFSEGRTKPDIERLRELLAQATN